MMDKKTHTPTGIAALDCSLQGGYLIEASAGTGKTWTLTGIILRLLIEKKYSPERIVATTFTKAAAAEMQERILQRLQNFYALIRWLKSQQSYHQAWFDVKNLAQSLPQIENMASMAGVDGSDPIHLYLLSFLIQSGEKTLDETIRRTGLLLTTLDKLFVGTLDSLTQKWLKEFSAQIGHHSDVQISPDATRYTAAMIHDELRAKEVQLKLDNPLLYRLLLQQYPNLFGDVNTMMHRINQVLQFFSAPIDEVSPADVTLEDIQDILHDIGCVDFGGLQEFYDANHNIFLGMSKKTANNLQENLPLWQSILDTVNQHGLDFIAHLSKQQHAFLADIKSWSDAEWKNVFNKKHDESAKDRLIALLEEMATLAACPQMLLSVQEHYIRQLSYQIALTIKERLAGVLEAQKQTTFTLQMVRLNTALSANPALAKHIRHHYPVALIDESQDVNGLQVELLEQVYLKDMFNYQLQMKRFDEIGGDQPKPQKGFLLLVGDPKQAIYRFRGGDVANYNLLKYYGEQQSGQSVLNRSLVLDTNRRSNRALIELLNVWFVDNGASGFANHANLGSEIYYRPISAFEETQRLSWQQNEQHDGVDYVGNSPLTVLHIAYEDKKEKYQLLAQHINAILQGEHYLAGRRVMPSDVAVLSKTNNELSKLQKELKKLNIPAIDAKDENVFMTQAGKDLYALMLAILQPNRTDYVGRWLVTPMMGLTLTQAMALLGVDDDEQMSDELPVGLDKLTLITYLKKAHDRWQKNGLAAALNEILLKNLSHEDVLILSVAQLGERYLSDLWQLIELIGTQNHLHESRLLAWYEQMMQQKPEELDETHKRAVLPSETGVHLMSIHKSKGLEFPIVYLLGLNKTPSENNTGFYPYSDEHFHRRISPNAGKGIEASYYADLDSKEGIDELRRLGYVGLTRASEQVFVVADDAYNKKDIEKKPLNQWLESMQAAYTLPARLSSVNQIELATCTRCADVFGQMSGDEQAIKYADWHQLLPQTKFAGVYQTSFTALVAHLNSLDKEQLAVAADYDELSVLSQADNEALIINPHEIRQSFIKGRFAGDFLHKVLQHAKHSDELSKVIDDFVKQLGLPSRYASLHAQAYLVGQSQDETEHHRLVAWLSQVMHTSFISSGVSLAQIDEQAQRRELSFVLGMNDDFSVDKLNQAFAEHSDRALSLLDDGGVAYRYLRGEIDLVYEHQGRFYVVDYKSNHLGVLPSDYHEDSLSKAMDKSGYWLQAAIYQVALHRLLKLKIADYAGQESRYLGSVEYVFLRGIDPENPQMGRLKWQPPLSLILALDEIL